MTKTRQLTHIDSRGQARMVDVGKKQPTRRVATAVGRIIMPAKTLAIAQSGDVAKGDIFAVARLAGINAAKKTAEWIPLCHILPLESVKIEFMINEVESYIECSSEVSATAKTGVEMEALTAVNAALLAMYDMLKAAGKNMKISDIHLLTKSGGKSGDFKWGD